MQASTRPRPQPGGQQRPQHGAQLSISDDNHHVTDAISSLYDYGDQHPHPPGQGPPQFQAEEIPRLNNRGPRPLSFLPSAKEELTHSLGEGHEDARRNIPSKPLGRAKTAGGAIRNVERPVHHSNRQYVVGRSISAPHEPALLPHLRSPADTATASFPLNDIDYESSPAAVAQELSNLQAIRRMSMNAEAAGDPDLPSFGHAMAPATNEESEDDESRLFWVPASLHPELAPKEFKSFLDGRVESLKRRSGEFNVPNDQPVRSTSGGSGGLRRKKSMLSRQIDNSDGRGAEGYQDGAERLDRKRSSSHRDSLASSGMANLQELEELVNDPSGAMSKLGLDTQNDSQSSIDEDMIVPLAPGGSGLKRSTRTTYRRASLRDGKRVPPSRRALKNVDTEQEPAEPSETSPSSPSDEASSGLGLTRVQTEPPMSIDRQLQEKPAENFSRPGRSNRRVASPPTSPPGTSYEQTQVQPKSPPNLIERKSPPPPQQPATSPTSPPSSREPKPFVSQISSNGRTTARLPAIYEPQPGQTTQQRPSQQKSPPPPLQQQQAPQQAQQDYRPPERVSSHQPISFSQPQTSGVSHVPPPPLRSGKRTAATRPVQQNEQSSQTLQQIAAHPSPLPGNSTRTDNLSFIPTLTEDKKADSKKDSSKKSGWGAIGSWLGGDERERERRREEEAKEAKEAEKANKKSKMKFGKPTDSGRLDVLQSTMDNNNRGRESLVLDRGDVKLEEERRKESNRGKNAESRKEKDGIFTKMSGFFGDSKKKPDREVYGKKAPRSYSPDPPRPVLKPDVDYNWTRFSIIEERAIYRMAHIKLANPRRPLYSQVLLSNFMYSYLAKVQQMHPTIQIPQSAAAKAQQRAQQQKKSEQPDEFYQYQRYQEQLQEQDRAAQQNAHTQPQDHPQDSDDYGDDMHGYDYEDGDEDDRPMSRADQHTQRGMTNGEGQYGQDHGYGYQAPEHSAYQYQRSQFDDPGRAQDEMW